MAVPCDQAKLIFNEGNVQCGPENVTCDLQNSVRVTQKFISSKSMRNFCYLMRLLTLVRGTASVEYLLPLLEPGEILSNWILGSVPLLALSIHMIHLSFTSCCKCQRQWPLRGLLVTLWRTWIETYFASCLLIAFQFLGQTQSIPSIVAVDGIRWPIVCLLERTIIIGKHPWQSSVESRGYIVFFLMQIMFSVFPAHCWWTLDATKTSVEWRYVIST